MKRRVFCAAVLLFLSSLYASDGAVESILKKLDRLDAMRIPSSVGYRVYDPFRQAVPVVKKSSRHRRFARRSLPRVTAIMNDMAFVGGRWVGVGDRIGGYRVAKIGDGGIVLKKGSVTRLLPLSGKKRILKIKENIE